MAANFYLHTRLAEVDVAVALQLKAHHVLHGPLNPRLADQKLRRSEAIREVVEDWRRACRITIHSKDQRSYADRLLEAASNRLHPAFPNDMIGRGTGGSPCPA